MRVLVVDDHLPTIELMRLTLASFGHSVLSATSVAEGVNLAAVGDPDVILSDLTFSSPSGLAQSGHALARAVRSLPGRAGVGLLAVTGVVNRTEWQAALDSGFDEVLVKPFELQSLLERVESLGRRTLHGS